MSVRTLLLFGVIKLLMVNVSVNLGWKGGTIFPMVYSSAAFSYAASAVIGTGSVESTFAAAIVTASMMGVLIRKPITVAAVLLLCFPPAFLPALLIAAFISAWLGRQFGK